ncbi:MAG: substrate-binding periplasmic protein [Proteocatella sp.]
MKTKISIFFIIWIVLFSGCTKINPKIAENHIEDSNENSKKSSKIIIVIDEWPPFTSKEMKSYGIGSQIVIEAMKAANLECEFQFKPWARALEMVKYEDAWGTFPWLYKEERSKDYLYSDVVLESSSKIFYKKVNPNMKVEIPDYKTIYDLRQFKFGGVYAYTYEKDFEKPENKFNYELYSTLELAFNALDKGNVDIINEDEAVGWYIISKFFPGREDEFATLEKKLITVNLYMLINKTDENSLEIMNKFNAGLKIIKENGKYDEIISTLVK